MASNPRIVHSSSYSSELDSLILRNQARRQALQAQKFSDAVTPRAERIRELAPWAPPEMVVQVALSNMDIESPEAQELFRAAARRKKKKGWGPLGSIVSVGGDVLGAVGKVGGVLGRGADVALGEVDESLAPVARAGVRGAALGAQSLYEEAQGAVRNVAAWKPGGVPVGGAIAGGAVAAGLALAAPVSLGAVAVGGVAAGGAALGALGGSKVEGTGRWELQSSGAVALDRLLSGEDVRLGHGWLPNVMAGEDAENPDATFTVGEEQRRRAGRVTIAGRSVTPGRLLTYGVLEPGSKPADYLSGLVDASVALSRLDPASSGLKAASNVNRNRKLFVEAGGLLSSRPDISPKVAQAWWAGATDLRDTLAAGDFMTIWKATDGKLGAEVTNRLAKAATPGEVDQVVAPLLGSNALRGPMQYKTFRPLSNVRLLQDMPGHTIDLLDPDASVKTLEAWLRNARMPEEQIGPLLENMADQSSRIGRYGAYRASLDATEAHLAESLRPHLGEDAVAAERRAKQYAKRLTRFQETADDGTRAYIADSIAEGIPVEGIYAGETIPIAKPYIYSEFVNRAQPLPDARDIRRATSEFAWFFDNPLVSGSTTMIDFVQGSVWKKSALLRGAYTVRVIGEEQVRMAASGLASLVNHPISLIAWRLGHKGSTDLAGNEFAYRNADEFAEGLDDFNRALNREYSFNGWINERRLPFYKVVGKDSPDFSRMYADELAGLAADPVVREVARNLTDLRGLKDDFWGNGAARAADASSSMQRYRTLMGEEASELLNRQTADAYIDSLAEIVSSKTVNDPDLIDAIRTGQFGGASVRHNLGASRSLRDYIDAIVDDIPEDAKAHGQQSIRERGIGGQLDHAVRYLFSNLMGERTNNLSRSPTFRQLYAERVRELLPFMDATAQARVADWARTNKLDDLATKATAATERGAWTWKQADTAAKAFALDGTRDLLYDLTKRSQFFDAARLIFPFGEAWKELTVTWAKIGVAHPQSLRRAQQVIAGGRAADPDHDGRGFFYENAYGEEVFAYPALDWISDKLTGVPVPLTGRLAGLSLMTEVLPGVGPVVQVPAGAFLPDKPEWDRIRGLVFPFGEVDTSHGVIEAFAPAWLRKFGSATGFLRDERQWNAAVMDTMRWLASTGAYDTSTVDGMNELITDARSKAQVIFALRGAAQFFAPTAPTPEWIVQDKNGDVQVAQLLIEDFHDMQSEDYTTAVDRFLDKYGEQAFLLMQGKTAEVTPAAPVTGEGADWERSHRDIVKSFPNVYGFFAPEGDDLDSQAFARAVSSGARTPLTVDQYLRLANHRVANAIYQQARNAVPRPNRAQQDVLRRLADHLKDRYPGFRERAGIPEKASLDTLIDDLVDASADERLADNPLVEPLRIYLEAREIATARSEERGNSPTGFRSAQNMSDIRSLLRGLGTLLAEREPAFARVWERVFDAELVDEEVPVG